jgi:hypothetical protein
MVHLAYARSCSHGAGVSKLRRASPKGVWWSTSVETPGILTLFGSRQAPVHHTTILDFYLNYYLYVKIDGGLG